MKPNLLLQTADFLAVDKPPGMSVHNQEDPQNLLSLLERQFGKKLYPVHRLDKETSGVQILALDERAARKLAGEFQERAVRKLYTGVVRGELAGAGVWRQPLSDKAEGRKNPAGLAKDRVACETRYQVLKNSRYFTLCEFDLITGRQHQIRKHAALAGHALIGDGRYGDPKYNGRMAEIYGTDRMFLHCSRVELAGKVIESPVAAMFGDSLKL